MKTENTEGEAPAFIGLLLAIVRLLGSLRFALAVVLLIAAACVAGTLIPQGYQVVKYLEAHPASQRNMEILDMLGLTHVFSSRWFVVLLCLLSASLLVCTYRRFLALQGAMGPKRVRVLGSLFTHVSLLLVLAGGVIRSVWGESGYIELREGQTLANYSGSQGPAALPFAVHLVRFEVELYGEQEQKDQVSGSRLIVTWPEQKKTETVAATLNKPYEWSSASGTGKCRVRITRYVADLCVDNATHEIKSRSDEPNNPAILVKVECGGQNYEQWVYARFPDFNAHDGETRPVQLRYEFAEPASRSGAIKSYKSQLQILEAGKVVRNQTIEVNIPFSYRGYTFYQSGYNPRDLQWTSLQVVRDPGVMVVYLGFALMMIGLTMVFWVAPMTETGNRRDGGVA